jgi:hypothetical protein
MNKFKGRLSLFQKRKQKGAEKSFTKKKPQLVIRRKPEKLKVFLTKEALFKSKFVLKKKKKKGESEFKFLTQKREDLTLGRTRIRGSAKYSKRSLVTSFFLDVSAFVRWQRRLFVFFSRYFRKSRGVFAQRYFFIPVEARLYSNNLRKLSRNLALRTRTKFFPILNSAKQRVFLLKQPKDMWVFFKRYTTVMAMFKRTTAPFVVRSNFMWSFTRSSFYKAPYKGWFLVFW